jgi:hypothetical protein
MTEPRFTATDTGFRDAVARSRRRRHRRRTATASAAGTTVAAAVAVLALGGTQPAPDSLRQNQPAAPPGLPQASPAAPSAAADVSPGARPPAVVSEPAPAATDATAPAAGPQAGREPGQAPAAAPRPSGSPTRQPAISSPVVLSAADYQSNRPCADTTGRAAAGWCVLPGEDFDGAGGQPTVLAVSLCRLPGFSAAAVRFPSTAEAGFALYDEQGQRRIWDHASQHPGTPSEHARTVEPGRCLVWSTTWTNRDDSGTTLPPGSYELRLAVRADNIDGANEAITQNYRYTVRGQ